MKKKIYKWLGIILCLVILCSQFLIGETRRADAASTGTVTATSLNVRSGPGTSYSKVSVKGVSTYLKKGDKVTILSEKSGWYKISFTFNGTKSEGYVMDDYIKTASPTTTPTPTPTPAATATITTSDFKVPAIVTATTLNVRKSATTTSSKLDTIKKDQKVTVLNEKIVSSNKWYRISYVVNKKTKTGYVLSDYIKLTLSANITGKVNSATKVSVRLEPSKDSKYVTYKISKKTVNLSNNKTVIITGETTDSNGIKWFKTSFPVSGVEYGGYLPANSVLIKSATAPTATVTPTPTNTPTPTISPTPTITMTPTPSLSPTPTPFGYIAPITKATEGKIQYVSQINVFWNVTGTLELLFDSSYNPILLSENEKVIVNNTVESNGITWYYVNFKKGNVDVSGYVQGDYVVIGTGGFEDEKPVTLLNSTTPTPMISVTPTPTPIVAIDDSDFESYMNAQGFPESYKPYLRDLHTKYPYWIFEAKQTGLDWNTAVANESTLGVNLISNAKSVEWKSLETGAYNWSTDRFIPFDGSTWVTPSTQGLEYYMDPRNFLTEKSVFQFETLTFKSQYQNQVGIESILYNTPMYNNAYTYVNEAGQTVSYTYSETFLDAAQYSGVSPYHLASRSKQEVVTGTTTLSSSVSGIVEGLEGLFNFYNIGAYNSTAAGGAIANALKYAKNGTTNQTLNALYLIPWDNPYDAIVGGAYIIGSNYISRGQDTTYLQKFNMTVTSTYSHQYMANIEAPNSEATKTFTAYSGMTAMPIVFSIPVYLNMPSTPCPVPEKAYNPNNWLKTLKVNGYSLSPTFDLEKDQVYSLIVPSDVTSITVSAAAVSSKASVSGTGTIALLEGNNTVAVTVTAENGDIRTYLINVVKES